MPFISSLGNVPGGQVGNASVVDSRVVISVVVDSAVVVVVVVVVVVGVGVVVVVVVVVVLGVGRSRPTTGFPPTVRYLSLGLTTGRPSLPLPNKAIPSWFTNGVPCSSNGKQIIC